MRYSTAIVVLVGCGFVPGRDDTFDPPAIDARPIDAPPSDGEPDAPPPFVCPLPPSGCAAFACASSTSCYYVCDSPELSWSSARDRCANEGMGCIVTIDDQAEQDCIVLATDPTFETFEWFGLVQSPGGSEPDGGWGWQCGSSSYSGPGWGGGEPNDQGNEDCAALTGGGGWFDGSCGVEARYICELPPP